MLITKSIKEVMLYELRSFSVQFIALPMSCNPFNPIERQYLKY